MGQHFLGKKAALSNTWPLKDIGETAIKERTVVLQPVAMVIPNRHCVYSPSRLRSPKEISYAEFLTRYADHPHKMRVCFDEVPSAKTVLCRSETVTAYGNGLDCWYIVVSPREMKNESSTSPIGS